MWQRTPILLLGEYHGQESLVGYSSGGRKQLDTTEATERACMERNISWKELELLRTGLNLSDLI